MFCGDESVAEGECFSLNAFDGFESVATWLGIEPLLGGLREAGLGGFGGGEELFEGLPPGVDVLEGGLLFGDLGEFGAERVGAGFEVVSIGRWEWGVA